ncbi:MAG: hypothetical protein JWN33_378 [Candidatus Saccharibacteria bacterium]|nr:hypothetical protein [Candidatus Saccharibacteria bacterium]
MNGTDETAYVRRSVHILRPSFLPSPYLQQEFNKLLEPSAHYTTPLTFFGTKNVAVDLIDYTHRHYSDVIAQVETEMHQQSAGIVRLSGELAYRALSDVKTRVALKPKNQTSFNELMEVMNIIPIAFPERGSEGKVQNHYLFFDIATSALLADIQQRKRVQAGMSAGMSVMTLGNLQGFDFHFNTKVPQEPGKGLVSPVVRIQPTDGGSLKDAI